MLAVLILSTKSQSYSIFEDAIRSSYGKELTKHNIKWFFYKGGNDINQIIDDTIHVNEKDSLENTYNKFLAAYKLLKTHHPKVSLIFRTNLSTFIDVNNFKIFLSQTDKKDLNYNGFYGEANLISEKCYKHKILHVLLKKIDFGRKIKFYSGAGFFINDENLDKLQFRTSPMIDDVEIGYHLNKARKSKKNVSRILIDKDFKKMPKKEYHRLVNEEILFQYKFKTSCRFTDAVNIKNFGNHDYRENLLCL